MVRLCRLLGLYEAITAALIRVGAPVWQDCFIFARDDVSDGDERDQRMNIFQKILFRFYPAKLWFHLTQFMSIREVMVKADYTRDLDKSKEGVILGFYKNQVFLLI